MKIDRKRHAFTRFGISGAIFTLLGPTLFWNLYPLGPYLAAAIAEACIHAMRFFAFRHLVFPEQKGYHVNPTRYLVSALPATLSSFTCIALLKDNLNRSELTFTAATVSLGFGFLWSRFVYTRNSK